VTFIFNLFNILSQFIYYRRGSKAVCPMSQICGM